jgi:hypothetical protein
MMNQRSPLSIFHGALYLCVALQVVVGCRRAAPSPVRIQDELSTALVPSGVEDDDIIVGPGERLTVSGLGKVKDFSAVRSSLMRGVEVDSVGNRIYCLVEVLHGCGVDPVEFQVERVRLSDLTAVLLADAESVGRREDGGLADPTTDGKIGLRHLSKLLEMSGIAWDGRTSVPFP